MTTKQKVVHPEGHAKAGFPTGVIQFVFDDKTTQEIDLNALDDDTKFQLMVHGGSQKIGDSYAGAKAEENPLAFAKECVAAVIGQLQRGEWRATVTGVARTSDLARALSAATGQALEAAVEFIGQLDDAQTKELRNKPKIKAQLAVISAAKAAARADALIKAAAEAEEKEKAAA